VAFDIIGPLELTEMGNRYILVLVDYYAKWAEAYSIPNHKSETVADAIVGQWISRHGVPLRLHCDNAQEFRSHILRDMRDLLKHKGYFHHTIQTKSKQAV